MSLLNFVDEKTKNEIEESDVEALARKHEKVIEKTSELLKIGVDYNQARTKSEMENLAMKPLEPIEFIGNVEFGKLYRISFFVNKEQRERIAQKWRFAHQFDEERIASSVVTKFVETILK